MKKYHVQIEDRGFSFDVVVAAESMSEAVKIVREFHCQPRTVEIKPSPTWVEPVPESPEEGYEIYEYTSQIIGDCEDCGLILFEGNADANDWPWQHASGDEGCYTTICYPCAMKRKEAGNYCPFYNHFYRAEKYGCQDCPAGECTQAQSRYYRKLKEVLKKSLSFSKAQPSEINEFLDNNEFGLAYDALQKSGSAHREFTIFMEGVRTLMDEGWK